MRRIASAGCALAGIAALVLGARFLVGESVAELENQVFTSRADRLRLVVPRGWRATDQPSYPGLLLWMLRSQPPGQIVLSSEAFTRELFCSWPVACRTTQDPLPARYACALRVKLQAQRLRVGPTQPGPKENEAAGLPSVWFEYEDGKHFLRQAVALTADRAISLVLSAPTNDARAQHARPFDQTLRTLRTLTAAESAPPGIDAGANGRDAARVSRPDDAGIRDAFTPPIDGAVLDAGVTFESAPAPRVNPVGPCAS
jgi:hypothetical protein